MKIHPKIIRKYTYEHLFIGPNGGKGKILSALFPFAVPTWPGASIRLFVQGHNNNNNADHLLDKGVG